MFLRTSFLKIPLHPFLELLLQFAPSDRKAGVCVPGLLCALQETSLIFSNLKKKRIFLNTQMLLQLRNLVHQLFILLFSPHACLDFWDFLYVLPLLTNALS